MVNATIKVSKWNKKALVYSILVYYSKLYCSNANGTWKCFLKVLDVW